MRWRVYVSEMTLLGTLGCTSTAGGGGGAGGAGGEDGAGGDPVECDGFDKACCPQFTTVEDCHSNSFPNSQCYWATVYTVTSLDTCEMTGPIDMCIPGSNGVTGTNCPPDFSHVYLSREKADGTFQVIDHEPCVDGGHDGGVFTGRFDRCNPPALDPHPVCDCFLEPAE